MTPVHSKIEHTHQPSCLKSDDQRYELDCPLHHLPSPVRLRKIVTHKSSASFYSPIIAELASVNFLLLSATVIEHAHTVRGSVYTDFFLCNSLFLYFFVQ